MAWFKMDDTWSTHPKVIAAGLHGRALWIAGGLHCSQQLTDGRIDKTSLQMIAALAAVKPSAASKLCELGLWIDRGDHYVIPNFLEYNPSREQVMAERDRWKSNKQRQRERARREAVDDPGDTSDVPGGLPGDSHRESSPSRPVPSPTNHVLRKSTSTSPADEGTGAGSDGEVEPWSVPIPPEARALVTPLRKRRTA